MDTASREVAFVFFLSVPICNSVCFPVVLYGETLIPRVQVPGHCLPLAFSLQIRVRFGTELSCPTSKL